MGFLDKVNKVIKTVNEVKEKVEKIKDDLYNPKVTDPETLKIMENWQKQQEREKAEREAQLKRDNMLNISNEKMAELEAKVGKTVGYVTFVQAHCSLFEPATDWCPAGAVVLFTTDEKKCRDEGYLKKMADMLYAYKYADEVPEDLVHIVKKIKSEVGTFVEEVPAAYTGGSKVFVAVECFEGKHLPKTYIPGNRILPYYLDKEPKVNYYSGLKFFKPAEYM